MTTLCPCSKEISDYSAHNQRAIIKVLISYDENEHIWLEDLIEDIEKKASCEVYPLLKREDEKFVTEHAYDNPKFVEDVLRDVVLMFRNDKRINYYEVDVESLESIHNHSAWAYQLESKK
ncbi:MAG: GTP cyclohydrolase I FolE2 [Clostridium sp.]|nr:GTP cyclohydrolase I FolE2 [Clostridium sp.]